MKRRRNRPEIPNALALPHALRNLDQRPPVTRREFLGRGLLGTTATVVGTSTMLNLFGKPRTARATLAPDIAALVNVPCNIKAGAGKIPMIVFDLAGGGNVAGSNALVGGPGGQLDFLTTAAYSVLGLPGNMIPNSSVGAGSFIDMSLGLAMHSDSAYLRGITSIAAATTKANVTGAVIPAISTNDTDLNVHNPMYGIHSAGAAGDLLVLIGTESTVSGGNSMAPSYMIDPTSMPTVVRQPSDVTGLVNTGALVGLLNQADAVSVLESAERISAMKLAQVNTLLPSAQDTSAKQIVQCSYVKAADLVDRYGNATQTLDPSQDPNIVGPGGIFTAAQFQDNEFLATASVMKMVMNGYAGAGTIEMGGFDYHTGDRATGEARDFKAGQCIGAVLEYAARVGVPVMIYVLMDGSLASNGMVDNSVGGRGKGVWTADNSTVASTLMLAFDPKGRPPTLKNQIGYFQKNNGSVDPASSPAANGVNLLAETVVLNYMALHGQAGAFQNLTWASGLNTGLGGAATYDALIAFGQSPSVVNGTIT